MTHQKPELYARHTILGVSFYNNASKASVYNDPLIKKLLLKRRNTSDEPVLSYFQVLSEFLAMISSMITMSPWYSWRSVPGCLRGGLKLGPMDKAQEWYSAKLLWYTSFYEREVYVTVFYSTPY